MYITFSSIVTFDQLATNFRKRSSHRNTLDPNAPICAIKLNKLCYYKAKCANHIWANVSYKANLAILHAHIYLNWKLFLLKFHCNLILRSLNYLDVAKKNQNIEYTSYTRLSNIFCLHIWFTGDVHLMYIWCACDSHLFHIKRICFECVQRERAFSTNWYKHVYYCNWRSNFELNYFIAFSSIFLWNLNIFLIVYELLFNYGQNVRYIFKFYL